MQISALQKGLGEVMMDSNGGRERQMKEKLQSKMSELTNQRASEVKFEKTPEGKIKLDEFLKKLDLGFKE